MTQKDELSPYRFRHGFQDGISIGLGYLFVSFGFGISAVGQGLRVLETVILSMTNLTSAGQVAGVAILAVGGTLLEMILTQLVINLRYALMGITLTQRMDPRFTTSRRMLLSFAITDEIFAVASAKPHPIGPSYFSGLLVAPYLGWTLGTLLGAVAGRLMPPRLSDAAGILIYAMFLAIVIPPMKREKGTLVAVLVAAALNCILYYVPLFDGITSGFSVIICAVVGALVAAALCPTPEESASEDEKKDDATIGREGD